MAIDSPTTRFTGLQFNPDESSRYNGFFVPQLTPEEITNIPVDDSKVGGIIYNLHTQELQYLAPTLQWVNITTDGSDGVFDDLTVNGTSTLHAVSATSLAASGAISAVQVLATGSIVANSEIRATIIYAQRPAGYLYTSSTPSFAVTPNTPIKIPGTSTAPSNSQVSFVASDNNLEFVPTSNVTSLKVFANGSFSFQFSTTATIAIGFAVNGVYLNPQTFMTVDAGSWYNLSINASHTLTSNSGIGEHIELWVVSSTAGTFSSGGSMIFEVTSL